MKLCRLQRDAHIVGATAAALMLFVPAAAQADTAVGQATEVAQKATAKGDAAPRNLDIGMQVAARDTISTDKIGKATFRFVDDTQLSVGPNSSVTLADVVLGGPSGPTSFVLRASRGVFRFATGRGDHDAYRIQTPTATIGVRGTQFDVSLEGEQTRVSVLDGEVVLCPNRGRANFADCVEAGVGQSVLSGRTSARVVPTPSLPPLRANLLPLSNIAGAVPGGVPALGRVLGGAAGAIGDAAGRVLGTGRDVLPGADPTRAATDAAGRVLGDAQGDLPLPAASSAATGTVGGAFGGGNGFGGPSFGGLTGGLGGAGGVGGGLGGVGGGLGGTAGGLGGAAGGLGGAVGGAAGGLGGVRLR